MCTYLTFKQYTKHMLLGGFYLASIHIRLDLSQNLRWCRRALDIVHTIMASASNWTYLIRHFGNDAVSDRITWCVGSKTHSNNNEIWTLLLGLSLPQLRLQYVSFRWVLLTQPLATFSGVHDLVRSLVCRPLVRLLWSVLPFTASLRGGSSLVRPFPRLPVFSMTIYFKM